MVCFSRPQMQSDKDKFLLYCIFRPTCPHVNIVHPNPSKKFIDRIPLLFADGGVLLASSACDLVSISNLAVMVSLKNVDRPLEIMCKLLPQVKDFSVSEGLACRGGYKRPVTGNVLDSQGEEGAEPESVPVNPHSKLLPR